MQISDTHFKNSFSERSVSDGTLKLLAYITLLAQSEKISFLMVEYHETQIYSETLSILFELFEAAAFEGLQTFLPTHSPDFIKNTDSRRVVIIAKKDGVALRRFARTPPFAFTAGKSERSRHSNSNITESDRFSADIILQSRSSRIYR